LESEINLKDNQDPKAAHWEKKMDLQETILIVEDEDGPRESLRMILKPFYDVYTVSNGQDAINLVQKQDISLVTLDLNMPGLSGIDTLKEIKKIKPEIEVVIITALATNGQESFRVGASGFITSSPFSISYPSFLATFWTSQRTFYGLRNNPPGRESSSAPYRAERSDDCSRSPSPGPVPWLPARSAPWLRPNCKPSR